MNRSTLTDRIPCLASKSIFFWLWKIPLASLVVKHPILSYYVLKAYFMGGTIKKELSSFQQAPFYFKALWNSKNNRVYNKFFVKCRLDSTSNYSFRHFIFNIWLKTEFSIGQLLYFWLSKNALEIKYGALFRLASQPKIKGLMWVPDGVTTFIWIAIMV